MSVVLHTCISLSKAPVHVMKVATSEILKIVFSFIPIMNNSNYLEDSISHLLTPTQLAEESNALTVLPIRTIHYYTF